MYQYADLLKNRRAIRDFTDEKVNLDVIHEILKEVCMAPSAMNRQPWSFIIILDKALMKKISDESKQNLLLKVQADPNSPYQKYQNRFTDPKFNAFYNAPCLVLMVSNHTSENTYYDLGLAAAYFMFAATARNLGTCWISWGSHIKDSALRSEIGLPADYDKIVPLIIGHPKQIPPMSVRNKPVILKTIS